MGKKVFKVGGRQQLLNAKTQHRCLLAANLEHLVVGEPA